MRRLLVVVAFLRKLSTMPSKTLQGTIWMLIQRRKAKTRRIMSRSVVMELAPLYIYISKSESTIY